MGLRLPNAVLAPAGRAELAALGAALLLLALSGPGAQPAGAQAPPVMKCANGPCTHSIYTVNVDGSRLREVIRAFGDILAPGPGGGQLQWTPDGRSIAFLKGTTESLSEAGVYEVRPDGTGLRKLLDSSLSGIVNDFSISPLGNRLVYTLTGAGQHVFVLDLVSGGQTKLTSETSSPDPYGAGDITSAFGPVFSSDGGRIAFSAFAKQRGSPPGASTVGVWLMNADGSGQHPLAGAQGIPNVTTIGAPQWTPDGRIRFPSTTGGRVEWRIAAPDGSGQAAVLVEPAGWRGVSWSPDATRIAYIRVQPGPSPGQVTTPLFVSPPGGPFDGPGTKLAPIGLGPVWSPDGTQIAFVAPGAATRRSRRPRKAVLTARRLSGRVRYRPPGRRSLKPLRTNRRMRYGSLLDVGRGRVRLTVRFTTGEQHSWADVSGGALAVKRDARTGPIMRLTLAGKLSCPGKGRQLAGRSKGQVIVAGRRSRYQPAAGSWKVADRCDGSTLTSVRHGRGIVFDIPKRRVVALSAPGSPRRYVAKPPRR